MTRWKLKKVDAASLLHLQEDSAGNLYWRGRRITAADCAKLSLAAMAVGILANLTRTVLDLGRTAGWWP